MRTLPLGLRTVQRAEQDRASCPFDGINDLPILLDGTTTGAKKCPGKLVTIDCGVILDYIYLDLPTVCQMSAFWPLIIYV